MRIWSIHPQHLDVKGLVALWREGLLARKVLLGETKGYRHHPQLQRFQAAESHAVERMDTYLHVVCDEADRRGYKFTRAKLGERTDLECIEVTIGQLAFEFEHLRDKVMRRTGAPLNAEHIKHHPMFVVMQGPKEKWERA
jgi:hypothetical protein